MDGHSWASRGIWEAWRLFIVGYARGKELYPLLRPDYTTLTVSTATTTLDQRRAYNTHQRNTQSLLFHLAQAREESAVAIVARCEHGDNPDDREPGWRRNASAEDVPSTSGLCSHSHWNDDYEISNAIVQKNQ